MGRYNIDLSFTVWQLKVYDYCITNLFRDKNCSHFKV